MGATNFVNQSENHEPSKAIIESQGYVEFRNRFVRISEIEDKTVSLDDLKKINKTTTVRLKLPPKLTDQALIKTAEHYLKQCTNTGYPFVTYEDALIHTIVPELINRLKERTGLSDKRSEHRKSNQPN